MAILILEGDPGAVRNLMEELYERNYLGGEVHDFYVGDGELCDIIVKLAKDKQDE